MSPIQHRWFGFLSKTFPITKIGSPWIPALKRVAFDQFLFAPAGLAAFFTYMTIAEGGGKRAVQRKFQDVYIPALKANFLIWPTVQIINFRVMPIQFQIVCFLALFLMVFANTFAAFCFHRRYRLDRIPLSDQLRRGGIDGSPSNDFPCTLIPGSHMVGSWSRHRGIPLNFCSERFCIGMVGSRQLGVDGIFRGVLSVHSSEMFTHAPRSSFVRPQLYYFFKRSGTFCVESFGAWSQEGLKSRRVRHAPLPFIGVCCSFAQCTT